MRHVFLRGVAALLAAHLWACSGPESDPVPDAGPIQPEDAGFVVDAGTPERQSDLLLRSSDPAGACAAYRAELAAEPGDTHAAFGAALACSLTLPDSPAVTELLDRCGEPHVRVATQVFGPNGMFAKDEAARAGTAALTLESRMGMNGAPTPVTFSPDSVRARVDGSRLELEARDVLHGGGTGTATLRLAAWYPNVSRFWNQTPTPLVDGLELPADELGIDLEVELPDATGATSKRYYALVAGSVLFRKVGTGQPGDAIEIEFKDVELEGYPGYCYGPCPAESWPYLKLAGTFSDTISAPFTPTMPFGDVSSSMGPPYRDALVVMIDRCPELSADLLQAQLAKLLDEVAQISGHLQIVVSAPDADQFQFVVPGRLFFVNGALPVNATDVRLAKAAVDAILFLGRTSTQYRLQAKTFDELMATYQRWVDGYPYPTTRQERFFLAQRVSDDLNANFLLKKVAFDLNPSRASLLQALDGASAALTRAPGKEGVFNFQTGGSRPMAAELDGLITFFKRSLTETGLLSFPRSPDFKLSLSALFDSPLDNSALHTASSSGLGIFTYTAGDSSAPTASGRNDSIGLDGEACWQAIEPFFLRPEDRSGTVCNIFNPIECPARYLCAQDAPTTGHCEAPDFTPVDEGAFDEVAPNEGPPVFFNERALDPLRVIDF